jgi:hypothetical protein
MTAWTLCGCKLLLAFALMGAQHATGGATIPAPLPSPEPQSNLPIDQPPSVVHGDRRQALDVRKIKMQADQLSKLAQSISPDVNKVSKGEMPGELIKNLKQIEKLSKQLRRELGR